MILDDLKDKALESFGVIRSQVEESDAYMQLRDKYESLPPAGQIALNISGLLLAVLLAMQIPLSFYNSSSDYLALVDENRDLILDFYQVRRESALLPANIKMIETSEIESRARGFLAQSRIPETQLESIMPLEPNRAAIPFLPGQLSPSGIEIKLKNLNLTQIVDLGHLLTTIGPTAFMSGLEIKPGSEPGSYFDVSFRMQSLKPKTQTALKKATDGDN